MSTTDIKNVTYSDESVKIKFKTNNAGKTSWQAESHTNTEYELHIMLAGSEKLSVENDTRILNPLDACIIAPGVYHLAKPMPGQMLHFTFLFTVQSAEFAEELKIFDQCVFFKINSQIENLCNRIFNESDASRPYRVKMIEALLSEIFIEICRHLDIHEVERLTKTEEVMVGRTEIIDSFFEKNHSGSECSENHLADMLHISRRQLTRILKKIYGMDFRSKMMDVRLKHATMLLRSTEMKISEISYAVGFSSEGSLYKHFQRYYGTTPLKYRKQVLKERNE
ncbi:MAG: AraC family transcriptional regulator [Eubacteriales bacterium]|nr:AraC family transcriptional regulator [Eubacteriales bacterium]